MDPVNFFKQKESIGHCHCSIKALRHYEKVSDVQKKAACNTPTGRSVESYSNEVERLKVDRGHCASSSASNYEMVKSMVLITLLCYFVHYMSLCSTISRVCIFIHWY